MKTKACFKCNAVKTLTEFYKHPKMGDGYLGKCKDCAKKDVAKRVTKKQLDPVWLANERARCRDKSNRARLNRTAVRTTTQTKKAWNLRNPTKRKAQSKAGNALRDHKLIRKSACEDCGTTDRRLHKHHPDYSRPLDVVWLCPPCHGKRHWKDQPMHKEEK